MMNEFGNCQGEQNGRQEVNLLDFVIILLKHKCLILSTLIGMGVILATWGVTSSYLSKETSYVSEAIISTNGSGLEVIQGSLRNAKFMASFIGNKEVMRLLFPERWDAKERAWVKGESPSYKEMSIQLRNSLSTSLDNNSIHLKFSHRDRSVPQKILTLYISEFEKYLKDASVIRRQETLDKIKSLSDRFNKQIDPLILKQLSAAMITEYANIRAFGFDIIDQPSVPEEITTKTAIPYNLIAWGLFFALILAVALSFWIEYLTKIRENESMRWGQIVKLLKQW